MGIMAILRIDIGQNQNDWTHNLIIVTSLPAVVYHYAALAEVP
jgi:hypothetical protein